MFIARLTLALAVFLLLAACATIPTDPLAPKPGKALVVFYADHDALFTLSSNGKTIGRISTGYYFAYQADPGINNIVARRGLVSQEKALTLDVGRSYYVNCDTESHFMWQQAKLVLVDPSEGAQAIQKLRRKSPL